ncbi:MAG TPA: ClbS/DfsB family four-helix bundle protein [Methylomirabilota bacterium]|nr:ClbS/DfsB family four-helix bundle protein [Methylomirabilota bacterium]
MSDKRQLLTEAETEFQSLKRAVAGLDDAALREVWCGSWSVREILGHISGWHREMQPALERLARGEKPVPSGVSYSDVDAWNAKFAASVHGSNAEILGELDRSHADFMRTAATVPDERVVPDRTAYKLIDANSRHHYREHIEDILAWRKRRGI